MIHIEESGLYFGDYEEIDFFHIEKSGLYADMGESIRTVEFIIKGDGTTILFIEAKSSAPHPGNIEDFSKFIQDMSEKIIHSNDLFFSLILKRKPDKYSEFPLSFRNINYETARIKTILIINNFDFLWLSPIQVALKEKLKRIIKTWQLEVIVLNHELAFSYKLARKPEI